MLGELSLVAAEDGLVLAEKRVPEVLEGAARRQHQPHDAATARPADPVHVVHQTPVQLVLHVE